MIILGYIDIRPFLFLGGLPIFMGLCLVACQLLKIRIRKWKVAVVSALIFTACFTLFLTGLGPFIDQKETREYWMTWDIKPTPPNEMQESEVVLTFVDFPAHHIGKYSDELARYLREKGAEKVKVVFEVTTDYGKVRGFHETDIGGLGHWNSKSGYSASSDSTKGSPWD